MILRTSEPKLFHLYVIIIIMEIFKVPTLRLKALNKHTHILYMDMENIIKKIKIIKIIITLNNNTEDAPDESRNSK